MGAGQNPLSQPRLGALPQRAWVKRRLTRAVGLRALRRAGESAADTTSTSTTTASRTRACCRCPRGAIPRAGCSSTQYGACADATVALRASRRSAGRKLAYALSDGGTDWQTWRFRRPQDGTDLPDDLRFTKFWGVSWARDGSGVYYSRYPALPR